MNWELQQKNKATELLEGLILLGYDITIADGQVLFANPKTGDDCLIYIDEDGIPV